jgi:flagellar basal-body rod protein FlgF
MPGIPPAEAAPPIVARAVHGGGAIGPRRPRRQRKNGWTPPEMENPAYIALSRQMVLRRQLDIIANNLANVNTGSYKREDLAFVEYLVKPDGAGNPTFARADGRVAMVQDLGMVRDTRQGPMAQTDAPMDLAINGEGYFVVDTPDGPRYTRQGRFQVDANSQLVTSDGYPVQGTDGPIFVPPDDGEVKIARDGTISTVGGQIGRVRLVSFADETSLKHAGASLYLATTAPEPAPDSEVIQGMVEESNVQPVVELTEMIAVLRNYQAAQKIVDAHDDMARRVINSVIPSS